MNADTDSDHDPNSTAVLATPQPTVTGKARKPYGNFHDPLGLVVRMLRSGDPAARAALWRHAAQLVTTPCDFLLRSSERRLLAAAAPSSLPLIFVVGAPRCGTTLVSQVFARYLDVSYFTNLTALFPRSPLAAQQRFGKLTPPRKEDFHSYYGQTAGLAAPNDGFNIWNRWLGSDRYNPPPQLAADIQHDCQQFFNAWLTTFGKPFLNKNNRNTLCCKLLADILPHAYFVNVSREPLAVVQSLVVARQRVQGSKRIGWGLSSRDQESTDPFGYVDDVCQQVLNIRASWDRQKSEIDTSRIIEIQYEDFCTDPRRVVRAVANHIPSVSLRAGTIDDTWKPFEVSRGKQLEAQELARARELLGVKPPVH